MGSVVVSPGVSCSIARGSPGYLPDPGIEPRSPALQADALTSEPPGNSTFNASFFLKKGINLHRKLSVLPASECLNKCLLLKPHF